MALLRKLLGPCEGHVPVAIQWYPRLRIGNTDESPCPRCPRRCAALPRPPPAMACLLRTQCRRRKPATRHQLAHVLYATDPLLGRAARTPTPANSPAVLPVPLAIEARPFPTPPLAVRNLRASVSGDARERHRLRRPARGEPCTSQCARRPPNPQQRASWTCSQRLGRPPPLPAPPPPKFVHSRLACATAYSRPAPPPVPARRERRKRTASAFVPTGARHVCRADGASGSNPGRPARTRCANPARSTCTGQSASRRPACEADARRSDPTRRYAPDRVRIPERRWLGGGGAGTHSGTLSLAKSGTSKHSHARDYFSHMEKHMIPFAPAFSGRAQGAPEPKRPKAAAAKDDDDNDEPPPPPPPKKRSPPKKAAAPPKVKPMAIDSDSDDEPPQAKGKAKAAPKRKNLDSAPEVTDFFSKAGPSGASSKPERKMSKSMKPASPRAAPSRPARAAPKKYVEISSDEGEDTAGDQSMFLDDDD
ncbi:hypothetical protein B0H15DRAFT_954131 [Mycena belliarum]|uniref:Uncharacterized protein n=1 Tax=Mycena belliarum TaxID=1033014 RepID=A0AAD6TV33_9AGAR|nr:hypothetical protein B0H15DRAFT_954131 [Mycena belliae]